MNLEETGKIKKGETMNNKTCEKCHYFNDSDGKGYCEFYDEDIDGSKDVDCPNWTEPFD